MPKLKWIIVVLALGLALFAIPASQAQGALPPDPAWSNLAVRTRIEPALLKRLLTARPNEHLPIIVTMRDAQQTTNPQSPVSTHAIDRATLVQTLRATAGRSQLKVLSFLSNEQAAGRVDAVRPYWIFNGLALHAAPQTIQSLASRDDVELIQVDELKSRISNSQFSIPNLQSLISASQSEILNLESEIPSGTEWGIQRVQADQVWAAFNITGTGVVVANLDTGVDFMHPALNANYRGNVGKGLYQHTGNWFDATDAGALYPYDGYGHGTHTMGTLAGQDGIGVAPGARWIAARILDSQGYGYDSWIHAGFQWMLAPNGDPALAPDVLSNSWGSADGTSTEFQPDLAQLRQAGILTVFSAGNNGPAAGTVGSPASLPGAFAVGAVDQDNEAASFSSRGPSPWDEVKPLIAAPGVSVRSSIPGGAYAVYQGTSMAAPHVAGVAALMLSAQPGLSITTTEYVLTSTAVPLASIVPNNDTGWGLVDAYAAVQAVAGAGTLEGVVVDAASRLPLPGATVTAHNYDTGRTFGMQTGADGRYFTALAAGPYSVTASLFGYSPDFASLSIVITGQATTRDLMLSPMPVGVVRGVLTDTVTGQPVTATISALGTPRSTTASGQYYIEMPVGAYTIQARALGYRVVTATIVISAGQVTQSDFGMTPTARILLVNGGAWYYRDYSSYFRQSLDELSYAYDELTIKHPISDTPVISDLLKYDLVIWSSPLDSPGYVGANNAISRFLFKGGGVIITGQDVAFWDGGGSIYFYASYLHDYLKTDFASDDAGARALSGLPDDFMAGLSFNITGGDGANDQFSPDEISVADADYAAQVLSYQGDGSGGQKVGLCLPYRGLVLPFGYEAISSADDRREVMRRALEYFASPRQASGLNVTALSSQTLVGVPGTVVTFTARVRNTGEVGEPVSYTAALQSAGWTAAVTPTRFTLAPCGSAAFAVQTSIPAGLGMDARNALTLTVRPVMSPTLARVITFTAKTPAPVLVVDDVRWFEVGPAYTGVLDQIGVPYDVWRVAWGGPPAALNGPPAERLAWYPVVIWFNGYDWYSPLTAYDETQLGTFLDQGGRLMLSSVFYLDDRGNSAFARSRLGVLDHTYGMTATYAYGSPGDALGVDLGPARLINPYVGAGFYTLDHVVVPAASADTAWRGDHNRALAIARSQPGNRLVFWGFPFEALPESARVAALRRTVGWLGPLGDSTAQVYPPVISPGQLATVTLTVRDNLSATLAVFTATLPIGVTPVTLPPGVVYAPGSNALTWSGAIDAGEAMTFTFPVTAGAGYAANSPPGSVVFRDRVFKMDFDQPLAVRVDAPNLQASALDAPLARPHNPVTVTMAVYNRGPGIASSAIVTGLAPLRQQVITGTVALDGPGAVQASSGQVTWRGSLDAGQSATVTYQITAPLTTHGITLPVEMLAWDGAGGAWEWRAWMNVQPWRFYLPWVIK